MDPNYVWPHRYDFGIEHIGKRHAQHLLYTFQEHYTITTDSEGKFFTSIDLDWTHAYKHSQRTFQLSMEGYIDKKFLKYGHTKLTHPEHTLHKHREIKYGAKKQLSPTEDTIPDLDATGIKIIQEIIVSLLYYARDVDKKKY